MTGLRARKKSQVRLSIVAAALRQFDQRGFAETTVDDIAAAADVSRRTFFRYFPSKEDVYLVDPERKLALIRSELRARRDVEPILQAIRRALAAIARDYASDADLVRLQYRVALREPHLAAHGFMYQVRWESVLAEAVAKDICEGPETGARARVVAHVAVGAARDAVAAWLDGGCTADLVALMMHTLDIVEPALAVLLVGGGTERPATTE